MSREAPHISVIIPAFNEENRIPQTLDSIVQYFTARGTSYELLVVDDGSTDSTPVLVRKLEAQVPSVRLLTYVRNRGKGYAVRFGMRNAKGELLLFNDADGASPIEEIERLLAAIDEGADIAIGSRALHSADTGVKAVWYRKFLGRVFSGLVNLLILPGIRDTQCGFKLFKRSCAEVIFRKQKSRGFSFDVEILFLARRAGYRIAEVPINWTNIPGSKVHLLKDSLRMARDVVVFRIRAMSGAYERTENE